MTEARPSQAKGTWLGIISILFWSTSVAFGRGLIERVGLFTATSTVFLLSGVLTCAFWTIRRGHPRVLLNYRPRYLWVCGSLFTLYVLCLYGAISASVNHQQVLEVGLLNYLWPAFMLVFSLPILGYRGRWTLWPGIAVALGGAVLATGQQGGLSWSGWVAHVTASPLPYGLAFVGAIAWGLFSNAGRRLGPLQGSGALPLFVLATGVLLSVIRLGGHEQPHWTWDAVALTLWMSIFPTTLAYAFWDYGVRTGNMVVLASLSYCIPAVSTLITCLFLGISPPMTTWLGCALIIAGAVVCRLSFNDERD